MDYIYTTSPDSVATFLADTIKTHLSSGETVLWLLSGGSTILTAVSVARQLQDTDVSKLAVSLADERYGPIGHTDENWQHLLDAGFDLNTSMTYRPLTGASREGTTRAFSRWVQAHITDADYSIGLFGIGTDGHTAGLKPGTPSVNALGWTTDFTGVDYERITITFDTIKQLDEAVTQAIGAEKANTLNQLIHQDIPINIQPAQVLKSVKKSTLFTDFKEITV